MYNNDDISYLTATPLTTPNINEFTLIGADNSSPDQSNGIYFDNNGGGAFTNGVVTLFDFGIFLEDEYSVQRTAGSILSSSLKLQYVSLINNQNDYDYNTTNINWPLSGCSTSIINWMNDGCGNEQIQTGNINIGFDLSMFENYCSSTPIFIIDSESELIYRSDEILKVGVIQEDPVFTWTQSCALIDACTAPLGRTTAPLMLYPNPGTDVLHIQLPTTINTAEASIRILNMVTGKIVYEGTANHSVISIQHLPIGHYQVQLQDNQQILQGRLFVER